MTDKARAELLADVLSRYEGSPNPRLREITEAAIRHLHAFAEEVHLQRDEWLAGIKFLTAAGQMCDDTRQEFILLSDTLGVSSLVEMLTHDGVEGSTENTVLGPFYVPGSPPRVRGESMLVDPDDGDRVAIRGMVTDVDHRPIAGDSPDAEAIKVLARGHQNLIWARTRQTNQLRNALREYYPAALEAFGDLADPDALAVLGRAPTPDAGAALSLRQLRSALKQGGRQRNLDRRAAGAGLLDARRDQRTHRLHRHDGRRRRGDAWLPVRRIASLVYGTANRFY